MRKSSSAVKRVGKANPHRKHKANVLSQAISGNAIPSTPQVLSNATAGVVSNVVSIEDAASKSQQQSNKKAGPTSDELRYESWLESYGWKKHPYSRIDLPDSVKEARQRTMASQKRRLLLGKSPQSPLKRVYKVYKNPDPLGGDWPCQRMPTVEQLIERSYRLGLRFNCEEHISLKQPDGSIGKMEVSGRPLTADMKHNWLIDRDESKESAKVPHRASQELSGGSPDDVYSTVAKGGTGIGLMKFNSNDTKSQNSTSLIQYGTAVHAVDQVKQDRRLKKGRSSISDDVRYTQYWDQKLKDWYYWLNLDQPFNMDVKAMVKIKGWGKAFYRDRDKRIVNFHGTPILRCKNKADDVRYAKKLLDNQFTYNKRSNSTSPEVPISMPKRKAIQFNKNTFAPKLYQRVINTLQGVEGTTTIYCHRPKVSGGVPETLLNAPTLHKDASEPYGDFDKVEKIRMNRTVVVEKSYSNAKAKAHQQAKQGDEGSEFIQVKKSEVSRVDVNILTYDDMIQGMDVSQVKKLTASWQDLRTGSKGSIDRAKNLLGTRMMM